MSAPKMTIDASFDQGELRELRELLGPRLYEDAQAAIGKDAVLVGDAAAKGATPVDTGHARRSTAADTRRWEIVGRYPYLDWLDKGEDARGRRMVNPRGGYQIRRAAREAVQLAMPQLIDKAGREIAERWSR